MMNLVDTSQPAKTQYTGHETAVVSAGQNLKIETSPGGEEILNETVPVGKTWTVKFDIEIVES